MLPRLSMVHQQDETIYFFVEVNRDIMYARVVRELDQWVAQSKWEVVNMKTCQFCARDFDPKVTTTPRGYCSMECSSYGERPYTRGKELSTINVTATREEKIEKFARKVVEALHNVHSGDDRLDCDFDVCIEAKILGI